MIVLPGGRAAGPFEIRPFQEPDRAAVKALWTTVALDTPEGHDADIDACLRSGRAVLFVGTEGAELVATVMAGSDGHRGWLYYLATAPHRRGRGHARAMVAHAERWLRRSGVPAINLAIDPAERGLESFCARLGYARRAHVLMGKPAAAPDEAPPGEPGPGWLRVTITFLEMTARPAIAAPPAPRLKLAMLRADRIAVPFYRFLYDQVGAPWLWHERRRMSDEALAAIVQHPDVDVFVLYAGGEPAGYAELDRRTPGEVELAYFGLMPAWIGHRIGPWFLHAALEAAWMHGPRRVWVHTCNLDHPRAVTTYQRAGFAPYRQQTKIIADPRPL